MFSGRRFLPGKHCLICGKRRDRSSIYIEYLRLQSRRCPVALWSEQSRSRPGWSLSYSSVGIQNKRKNMFRRITVAFDESAEAGRALQAVIELAKSLRASLTVISVIERSPIYFSFSTSAAPYIRWSDE